VPTEPRMKFESRTKIVAPNRGYTTVITGGPLTCGIGGSGGAGATISAALGSAAGVGAVFGGALAHAAIVPQRHIAASKRMGTDTTGN
jgi:hypothetical protein